MESFNQKVQEYMEMMKEDEEKRVTKKRIVQIRKVILAISKNATKARKELSDMSKSQSRNPNQTKNKKVVEEV